MVNGRLSIKGMSWIDMDVSSFSATYESNFLFTPNGRVQSEYPGADGSLRREGARRTLPYSDKGFREFVA